MKRIAAVFLALATVGCAMNLQEWTAQEAQAFLLGYDQEQVLACMGPPANRGTAGSIEGVVVSFD
jgi:hypothetical protein